MGFEAFYHMHYKKLMMASITLLILSILFLGIKYAATGEIVPQSVSLKGGLTVTLLTDKNYDINQLKEQLSKKQKDINIRVLEEQGKQKALIFETANSNQQELLDQLKEQGLDTTKATTQYIGSSLGEKFYKQTIAATIFAFIAMSIVVFITFRNPIPASFVVLAAFSDIISTLAVLSIANVALTTSGIAAFLMLIGYSVDTDVLLTTRVLRRKEGTLRERINDAAKTGLTMSLTSLAATTVGYFLSNNETIQQIMLVLSIGLVFDIIYTWVQNATILRVYLERKGQV